jgi:hypothetical protein
MFDPVHLSSSPAEAFERADFLLGCLYPFHDQIGSNIFVGQTDSSKRTSMARQKWIK